MIGNTRVGIVGAGQIVENAHLPVLLNQSYVTVAWVVDVSESRSRLISKMYGVPARDISRFDSLLDDVDVCLLATPVGVRAPYFDACEMKRKAVLAEKPFATSAAQHQALCDRFPEHVLGASFQRRFYASTMGIRAIVEHGPFGALEAVSFALGGFDLKSGGPTRYLGDPRLAGGGVVMELGVHALDQVLYACGATDVTVDHVTSIALDGLDYDVILDASLRTPRGPIRAHAEISRLRPLRSGFTFTFERSTVAFGIGPDATLTATARDGGPSLLLEAGGGARTASQAFSALWASFLRGRALEQRSAASASTSVLTACWVDGIYARIPS
jgi:predicted dehydrogenase